MKRVSLVFLVAMGLLAAPASLAAASVTIGQLAPGIAASACGTGSVDRLSPTVTSGNDYVVPATGGITSWTLTSWSHNASFEVGQALTMKVFRQVAGLTYSVVGHDGPRNLTANGVNTFPTSIPVRSGDILGSRTGPDAFAGACFFSGGGTLLYGFGDLADGAAATFTATTGLRVNVSAVTTPSNSFSLGKAKSNEKKGTATLNFNLPNPGELTGSGNGVRAASAGAVISKSVAAGPAQLLIKAKGKKKKTLNETGKVKLNVAVTYTPTNGDPSTQSVRLKLIKR